MDSFTVQKLLSLIRFPLLIFATLFWPAISAERLIGAPLCILNSFSLAAFKILSLSLVFAILITLCLGEEFFGFTLFGTHCTSWTWMSVFFPRLEKFSAINTITSNKFSAPFFLFSFWTPTMPILVCLMLS